MLFSLCSFTVFGDEGGGNTGGDDSGTSGKGDDSFSVSADMVWGYRLSVYFFKDGNLDVSNARQVGSTVDVILHGSKTNPHYQEAFIYSLMNVYQRMNNFVNGAAVSPAVDANGLLTEYPDNMKKELGQHGMFRNERGSYSKEPNVYHYADKDPLTEFLNPKNSDFNLINLYADNKPDGSYNIFFTGVPEGHISDVPADRKDEIDFTHSAQVVRLCLGDALNDIPAYAGLSDELLIPLMEQDFRYGIFRDAYTDKNDSSVRGIYKIYIEPLMFIKYNTTNRSLMTFRDMLAFIPQTTVFGDDGTQTNALGSFAGHYLMTMGQRLHLSYYEPTIHMTGPKAIHTISSGNMKKYSALGEDLFNSAGVGVITGGEEAIEGPSVVKMYVYVDSVDADGRLHFKKAAPTTIEDAEFVVDEKGNLTLTPVFKNVEHIDGGVAVLNDILAVDEDLTIHDNSEWLNTTMPQNIDVDLEPNAKDIAGYLIGIVTDTELFVNTYKEMNTIVLDSNAAFTQALAKIATVQEDEDLGSAKQHVEISNLKLSYEGHLFYVETIIKEAQEYKYFDDIKVGMLDDDTVVKITDEKAKELGITTPANTLILRYIVKPTPSQLNVIEVYDENTGKTTYFNGGKQDLLMVGDKVIVQDPDIDGVKNLGTPELVEWVTNSEYPTKDITDGVLPSMSDKGLKGSDKEIPNYPTDPVEHNLYVKWKLTIPKKEVEPGTYFVPQWRLSKYFDASTIPDGTAGMSLSVSFGCCGAGSFTPTGAWKYAVRNPNGQLTQANHSNMKVNSWLHSETVKSSDAPYISINSPSAWVNIDGVMNGIKSTDTSGIKVAKWLNAGSIEGLKAYDILADVKGGTPTQADYSKTQLLQFGVYNTDTYINSWPYGWYTYDKETGRTTGHYHSWIYSKSISPSQASYTPYSFNAEIFFARYIAKQNQGLTVASSVESKNGETKVSYQIDKSLTVYPEIAMLFDNDSNVSSIKWAAGEQGRVINPVIYHNMKFDAFVTQATTGSSVATDSRAIQKARQLGFAKLQVIYKGASVNTSFFINKSKGAKEQGTLTVSTYALDINTNKNGVNLKSAWGASSYNPLTYHTDFLSKWNFTGGTITSRLEIDGVKQNYIGANVVRKNAVKMKQETFGGKSYKEYTHELIVRGGTVVGVKVQNRDTLKYTIVQIADLQKKDPALYDALVNMKLIGKNKDETLLKSFEHQTGATLTEQKYADMVANEKKSIDGFATNNISVNKGWYSEDTTALVIKEYVSVYDVPNVAANDKISMTVKGLETPTNKNQFFNTMGKGHNFLNVMFEGNLSKIKSDLQTAKVYFEHTSRETNDFGDTVVDYLVPNVSVADSTRLG